MFGKSIKSILSIAVIATGAAFSTTGNAQAGGNFGVYIGNGHGGIYAGSGGYHGPRHFRGGHRHRGVCAPRRALRKAWNMGVNRPHIARVNKRAIAVVGYNRGHRAKVVFKRHSPNCRVIKVRGLRRY